MNDWEFGSDKEMSDAVRSTRCQKLTAGRMGEYAGGFAGLLLAAGFCLVHFFVIEWPHPSPLGLVMGYVSTCVALLFAGAAAGKKLFAGPQGVKP